MDLTDALKRTRRLVKPFLVTDGKGFRLKDFDPGDTLHYGSEDRPKAKAALAMGVQLLAELQDMLYAQDRWSLLVVFQAMDAAGKDGAIKHVMSGVNPQGCHVTSFKAPSAEELDHDYMWRCYRALPARGQIGIFNRSYYEEVLVARVHPRVLESQKLPPQLVTERIWKDRCRDIRAFERYLARNGTVVLKIFLHVSRKEQKRRFLERIDNAEKNWKFSAADVEERAHWSQYQEAYEFAIRETATRSAPWLVAPADNKWFTRVVVAAAIIQRMASLDLHYPVVSREKRARLAEARERLMAEA
ncbi:MAG: polyphosphate kinase 2 family protein [Phycisphaerales bacterium]